MDRVKVEGMAAETLNCPMCGAPQSTDAPNCEHCGARLATVACPACFGLVFEGAKFCSHCGAKVERTEVVAATRESCPRCRVQLEAVKIGSTDLRECPHCEGIWVQAAVLQQICADREKQVAVLGMAVMLPEPGSAEMEKSIRYLPCPVCNNLMNRVNFSHCSNVIVDVCTRHGTWFDKDELRRIVEFIRAGGIEKERGREIRELEERRSNLTAAQISTAWDTNNQPASWNDGERHNGISAVANILGGLFGD
jgi:Zn-finger nucleic acid-binding protein